MKTATHMKDVTERANTRVVECGHAAVYKLSEPYAYERGSESKTCAFMFVSTTTVLGEEETYAFPADESGTVVSWGELDGSEKGSTSHAKVLENMGYSLIKADA